MYKEVENKNGILDKNLSLTVSVLLVIRSVFQPILKIYEVKANDDISLISVWSEIIVSLKIFLISFSTVSAEFPETILLILGL